MTEHAAKQQEHKCTDRNKMNINSKSAGRDLLRLIELDYAVAVMWPNYSLNIFLFNFTIKIYTFVL